MEGAGLEADDAPGGQVAGDREPGRLIQPAAILVNIHRMTDPDDSFYDDRKDLPMGALSTDRLVLVIAKEIQQNIVRNHRPVTSHRMRSRHRNNVVIGHSAHDGQQMPRQTPLLLRPCDGASAVK